MASAGATAAWGCAERPVDEGCVPRRPRASSRVLSPTRRRPECGSVLALSARDPLRPASRQLTPRLDALRPASLHLTPRHASPRAERAAVRQASPRVERLQIETAGALELQREATWAAPERYLLAVEELQREATWAPESVTPPWSTRTGAGVLPPSARKGAEADRSPRWRKLEPALHSSRSNPCVRSARDQSWSHREDAATLASPKSRWQAAKDSAPEFLKNNSSPVLDDERGRAYLNVTKAVQGRDDAMSGGVDGWITPKTGGAARFDPLTGRTLVGEQGWPVDDWHASKVRRWSVNGKDGQDFIEVPIPDRETCQCIVQ